MSSHQLPLGGQLPSSASQIGSLQTMHHINLPVSQAVTSVPVFSQASHGLIPADMKAIMQLAVPQANQLGNIQEQRASFQPNYAVTSQPSTPIPSTPTPEPEHAPNKKYKYDEQHVRYSSSQEDQRNTDTPVQANSFNNFPSSQSQISQPMISQANANIISEDVVKAAVLKNPNLSLKKDIDDDGKVGTQLEALSWALNSALPAWHSTGMAGTLSRQMNSFPLLHELANTLGTFVSNLPGTSGIGKPPAVNIQTTPGSTSTSHLNVSNGASENIELPQASPPKPKKKNKRKSKRVSDSQNDGSRVLTSRDVLPSRIPRKHRCDHCNYQTDNRSHLRRHYTSVHSTFKPFVCYICAKEFSRSEKIRAHFIRVHPELQYDSSMARKSIHQAEAEILAKEKLGSVMSIPPVSSSQGRSIGSSEETLAIVKEDILSTGLTPARVTAHQESPDRKHRCPVCTYSGKDNWHLKRHISDVHEQVKEFRCPWCPYATSRKHRMISHMKGHGGLKCFYCDFISQDSRQFQDHVKGCGKTQKNNLHICHSCGEGFASAKSLHAHTNKVHVTDRSQSGVTLPTQVPIATFTTLQLTDTAAVGLQQQSGVTPINQSVFPTPSAVSTSETEPSSQATNSPSAASLRVLEDSKVALLADLHHQQQQSHQPHQQAHHHQQQHPVTTSAQHASCFCTICGQAFPTQTDLEQHVCGVQVLEEEEPTGQELVCGLCNFSTMYRQLMKVHMKDHETEVQSCKEPGCDFRTTWSDAMKAHTNAVHSSNLHNCTECGKTFQRADQLVKHAKIHSKSHLCETCGRSFSAVAALRSHVAKCGQKLVQQQQHKMHSCNYANCRFRTKDAEALHHHVESEHCMQRDWQCPDCLKCFKHPDSLSKHMKTHIKEEMCQICGQKFSLRLHLRAHLQKEHEIRMPFGGIEPDSWEEEGEQAPTRDGLASEQQESANMQQQQPQQHQASSHHEQQHQPAQQPAAQQMHQHEQQQQQQQRFVPVSQHVQFHPQAYISNGEPTTLFQPSDHLQTTAFSSSAEAHHALVQQLGGYPGLIQPPQQHHQAFPTSAAIWQTKNVRSTATDISSSSHIEQQQQKSKDLLDKLDYRTAAGNANVKALEQDEQVAANMSHTLTSLT